MICLREMISMLKKLKTILLKWLSIITETRDEIIPKVKLNYYNHARGGDYLKMLETIYKNILNKL